MATTYYVSPTGSDSNIGSSAAPWLTFSHAFNQVAYGDTIKAKDGVYEVDYIGVSAYRGALTLATNNITIEADTSATPIIDGGYSTWPAPRTYENAIMLEINSDDCTVDGLTFRNWPGEGVFVRGDDCTIQNCTLSWIANRAIYANGDDFTLQECTVLHTQKRSFVTGAAVAAGEGASNVTFTENLVGDTGGQGLITWKCDTVEISKNRVYNARTSNIYVDACPDATVEENICYNSTINEGIGSYSAGINFGAENYGPAWLCENAVCHNNLVVGTPYGMVISTNNGPSSRPSVPSAGFQNMNISNNTIVNTTTVGIWFDDKDCLPSAHTDSYFLNNIILHDGTGKIADYRRTQSIAKFDFNNNLWSSDPGTVWRTTYGSNNEYTSINKDNELIDWDAAIQNPEDFDIANYKIPTGSTAKDMGTASNSPPSTDFFGSSRPFNSVYDAGFHEFGGTQAANDLSPAYTVTDSTPEEGDTITFSDNTTTAGNATVERVEWEFEGGSPSTSTASSPTVTYSSAGSYSVKYTVHDDTYNIHQSVLDNNAITVSPQQSAAPLVKNLVSSTAGTTAVAHGMSVTPNAIIFLAGTATANADISADTGVVTDADMCIGFWANDNNAQYVASAEDPSGLSSRQGLCRNNSGQVIRLLGAGISASVLSVDGTNVNLSWSGSTGSQKFYMLCLGGSAISEAYGYYHTFGVNGGTVNQTSDADLLICPTVCHELGVSKYGGILSLGFAHSTAGQGCGAIIWPRATTYRATVRDDAIAWRLNTNWKYSASFGSGQYSITGSNIVNTQNGLQVLAIKTSNVDVEIDIGSTPTTDAAADTTASFNPGILLSAMTNITSTNSYASGDNVGFFGIYLNDGVDEAMVGMHSDPDLGSNSDSGTLTDDEWSQINHAGTGSMTGNVTLGTAKFTMDMDASEADSTARYFPYLLIEASASAELTARGYFTSSEFYIDPEDGTTVYTPRAGETFNFYSDNSQTDGVNAITGWDWDFGDTTSSSSQNPTKSYTSPGTYTVSIEVTDAAAATDTYEFTAVVSPAEPTVTFTTDPDPATGNATLTVEIDPTVTAGSGGTLSKVTWWPSLRPEGEFAAWGAFPIRVTEIVVTSNFNTAFNIELPYVGVYDMQYEVEYTDGSTFADMVSGALAQVNDPDEANVITIVASTDKGAAFVGPKDVDFDILLNGNPTTSESFSSISWDFGDTQTSSALSPTNTYAAVGSATWYDIELDVTLPDGTTLERDIDNFIELVPTPANPPLFSVIYGRIEALVDEIDAVKVHLGFVDATEWVQESSPNTNVYKAEFSAPWVSGITLALLEDGTTLTTRASVALCQANAGSAYLSFSAGTLTIYVHPTASDSPITNGIDYVFTRAT